MTEKSDKIIDEKSNSIASVSFKRLNIIPIISGLILIAMAFVNIPYIIDEKGVFSFGLLEPPAITFLAELNIYIFLGFIPIIFGSIFIIFAFVTSRTISLDFIKDSSAGGSEISYKKKGFFNKIFATNQNLISPNEIQQIVAGKRHHRFLTWAAFAFLFVLIYLLTDYINYLNLSFDVYFISGGIPISTRWLLTINIIMLLVSAFLIVIYPRRLFQLDTPEDLVKFDYTELTVERFSDESKSISILEIIESTRCVLAEKKIKDNNSLAIDELKGQIKEIPKSHIPFFSLILSDVFMIIVIIIQIIPDFFLLDFTADIKFFLTFNSVYFFMRLHHSFLVKEQSIKMENNSIVCLRKNPISGYWLTYNNFQDIELDHRPYQPHYLEFFVVFFPIMELIWVIYNMIYFAPFFLINIYTIPYILVIFVIMACTILQYTVPYPTLSMVPKTQSREGKEERFHLYFPITPKEKIPDFGSAFKSRYFKTNYFRALLIISVPVIFGVLWVVLSVLGIVPPLESTMF